ncbi:hypothetical protein RND71_039723 [Anisodus tanguticus]|uniref:Uncharacterized protein n=1 Tax=Anisodus tanguticus TaxID=243964 RepID=A0AAE1R041_9SOLA|nr:hypothetical protein RND71_039723 [Anisodus tanguticus]
MDLIAQKVIVMETVRGCKPIGWSNQGLTFIFRGVILILGIYPPSRSEIWRLRTATVLASCGSSKTGFDDKSIHEIFQKCKRLEGVQREKASENWDYLRSIGILERKLPCVVRKCPKILTMRNSSRWFTVLRHWDQNHRNVEEKLCPLLAFFEALGVTEKQLGKMILINPRIISYSIQRKLSQMVEFLSSLHLSKDGMIGKVLVKHPYVMGYSVDKRLRPTSEFLKSLGLTDMYLQKVAVNYPEVLCRDVNKILKPNLSYLTSRGFGVGHIAAVDLLSSCSDKER